MWSDAISWIGAPEAYNWITLVGAIAAMFTAVFTGYVAFLTWIDRRQIVRSEWEYSIDVSRKMIEVKVHISNETRTVLMGERFRAVGPVASAGVFVGGKAGEKHESWANNETPTYFEVAPGAQGTARFFIIPDATRLRQSASSWWKLPRELIGRVAWLLLRWRIPFGAKYKTSLILRRRSSQIRPIRLTESIRIYAPQAIKMADSIEKSADSK